MQESVLRLFKGVFVENKVYEKYSKSVIKRGLRHGYVLQPGINVNEQTHLLNTIESQIGLSGEKANATFQKSWNKIKKSRQVELFLEQALHYITTYDFESLGLYDEGRVFLPKGEIDLPSVSEDIPLIVIKPMSRRELTSGILKLTRSGIALSDRVVRDITIIVSSANLPIFPNDVKNRELQVRLHIHHGTAPIESEEYLRFLIYALTNETLVIKNEQLISKIKEASGNKLDELITRAPDDLASIFFRYKPLFLAMKSISNNKTFFNQLRKKANKLHIPLPEDFLNSVTGKLKKGELDFEVLERRIKNASIFRKIRLAYALKFRLNHGSAIVHKIRNGAGWAKPFNWNMMNNFDTANAFKVVYQSIIEDLRPTVAGKVVYMPLEIEYTLPATEKQFTGNFPTGSFVTLDSDVVTGIHWVDTNRRIDLDLALVGQSGKTGWDSEHKTDENRILFSGDMTYAPKPNGATELMYLKQGVHEPKIITVNFFNHENDEVECRFLVAKEDPGRDFCRNYMVDVNNIIAQANLTISKTQNIIGLIYPFEDKTRVYFSNVSIGGSVSSRESPVSKLSRDYLIASVVNSILLSKVLKDSGAYVVRSTRDLYPGYLDLSPEAIDKTTIIDLVTQGKEV